ncbi:hypothetical protein [Streptococcus danieliae]|uniref:Uncharacterized protein n=1 Tax=Streptococcus danieliae TaxID=747656 RepID=A0A7Z0M7T5_9STRE|nr:hypothetical protein [Streptococcus danieliae]MBF0700120.1 hypothetical protein [Streptococcus danieliae]NYS97296.1 hypothetical protein [Streptococcus danieliae]
MKKVLLLLVLVGLVVGGWILVQSNSASSKGSSSFQLFGTVDLNEENQDQDELESSDEEDSSEEEDDFGNFVENHKTPWSKKVVIEDSSQEQSK